MESPVSLIPRPLPAHHVEALTALGNVKGYPRNAVILNEGDPGDTVFVILKGRVKVFLNGEDGKELLLHIRGPGEHFGEMALDYGPRGASIMTLEPCRFAVIPREAMEAYLLQHPDLGLALIRLLIGRMRALTQTVGDLAMLDVYGRVVRLMQGMACSVDGVPTVHPKPTQADMARQVGASREMVSRIFRDLRSGGYIRQERDRILIVRQPPKGW
ncbi:MAG: Crp/Fnr family transcriptional regulator [Burkholderiales bacterium]|nr:Crp/Fnr family transcriptional regulator [Burkholderiales bacterium]